MTAWSAFAGLLLLLANAFFVAAEFALIASRRTRLEQLAEEGDRRAVAALRSVRDLSVMLAAAQLGITMASLGLGFVAEPAVAAVVERALHGIGVPESVEHTGAVVIALTIVVFLHMVIGEMAPKNIAIAEPERSALWLARPMRAFTAVFRPFIAALNAIANGVLVLMRIEPKSELVSAHTADEIASMLAASRSEGLVDDAEHRLLSGALGFPARTVSSVMVPRADVVALRAAATPEELQELVNRTGHSRFPVYEHDLDEVLGFVHAKALLEIPTMAWGLPMPSRLIRRMLVVAADDRLPEVMVEMRRAGVHFALVTGAGGNTEGIVTLEDVLEALVGDIRDEYDRPPTGQRSAPG